MGYIDKEQLLKLAEPLKKTAYGQYLVAERQKNGVKLHGRYKSIKDAD